MFFFYLCCPLIFLFVFRLIFFPPLSFDFYVWKRKYVVNTLENYLLIIFANKIYLPPTCISPVIPIFFILPLYAALTSCVPITSYIISPLIFSFSKKYNITLLLSYILLPFLIGFDNVLYFFSCSIFSFF